MRVWIKMPCSARPVSASSSFNDSKSMPVAKPRKRAAAPHSARARAAVTAMAAIVALSACQTSPAPQAAASAPSAPVQAAAAARPAIDWPALQRSVGTYPTASQFLQQPGLNQRLRALLGPQYDLAMRNLQVASPLQQERGVYYVTGNRAHQGGVESVAIAMQAASNSVRVWLLHEGREQVLEEQRNAFAWPTDVQTLITNNHHNPARR